MAGVSVTVSANSTTSLPASTMPPGSGSGTPRVETRTHTPAAKNNKLVWSAVALGTIVVIGLSAVVWTNIRSTRVVAAHSPASSMLTTPTPDELAAEEDVPALEHVSVFGMEFSLPPGFTWTETDGAITAVGRDPELRIILDSDPTFHIPPADILREIRLEVDADERLSNPVEQAGKITYQENPGDESVVIWTSWVEAETLLSVGCHTRTSTTVAQRAACRIAAESLHPTPGGIIPRVSGEKIEPTGNLLPAAPV